MIANAQNERPLISFPLGSLAHGIDLTFGPTNVVMVYLMGTYNPEYYNATIKPIVGLTIVKQTKNSFKFTATTPGTYTIELEVTNTQTGAKLVPSNKITLNVF